MKKLPKLPEYPSLDEVAAWLTEASDEAWSPPAVLSRLLEWEGPEVVSDGTVRQSRIATSREVWVAVPPGEAMTAQLDGVEVVTRGGLLAYVLEPIDLFVRTVWLCGEAVPTGGVSTQDGKRFHVTRSFSVHDVRIPRNDVFKLLPAFDQLMRELDSGEHSDLARLVDDVAHGSVVSPTKSNLSIGEQDVEEDSGGRLGHLAETIPPSTTTSRVPTEEPACADAEPVQKNAHQENLGMSTNRLVSWQRAMLECWPQVVAAYGDEPKPRDAMLWLKKHGPRDVIPEHQPYLESMQWCAEASDGSIHTVTLKTIRNVISVWRKAGKLPAKK